MHSRDADETAVAVGSSNNNARFYVQAAGRGFSLEHVSPWLAGKMEYLTGQAGTTKLFREVQGRSVLGDVMVLLGMWSWLTAGNDLEHLFVGTDSGGMQSVTTAGADADGGDLQNLPKYRAVVGSDTLDTPRRRQRGVYRWSHPIIFYLAVVDLVDNALDMALAIDVGDRGQPKFQAYLATATVVAIMIQWLHRWVASFQLFQGQGRRVGWNIERSAANYLANLETAVFLLEDGMAIYTFAALPGLFEQSITAVINMIITLLCTFFILLARGAIFAAQIRDAEIDKLPRMLQARMLQVLFNLVAVFVIVGLNAWVAINLVILGNSGVPGCHTFEDDDCSFLNTTANATVLEPFTGGVSRTAVATAQISVFFGVAGIGMFITIAWRLQDHQPSQLKMLTAVFLIFVGAMSFSTLLPGAGGKPVGQA